MDVLMALIIKYLNGCLFYDHTYRIFRWILIHSAAADDDYFCLENLTKDEEVTEEQVLTIIRALGDYEDFDAFRDQLLEFQSVRLDQIRSRMIGLKAEDFLPKIEKSCSDEEFMKMIDEICECINKCEAIILVGALYPMSLATEFQTDMNVFGKIVLQHNKFDQSHPYEKNNMIICLSATGRAFNYYLNAFKHLHPENATKVLVTQNASYLMDEFKVADYTIHIPGRFDGININYQFMQIFDLLRVRYYQNYYLKK